MDILCLPAGGTPAGSFAMNCHQLRSAECRGQQGSEGVMAIFTGTSGSDLLNGTSDADTIGGAAGADTLNGADAADTLTGSTGADRLSGGAGSDLFAFQAGDSVLTIAGNRVGTISGYDVIADFASGETGDKIASWSLQEQARQAPSGGAPIASARPGACSSGACGQQRRTPM